MPSSYPGAPDTFPTHVDNVGETIQAAHLNNIQNAVLAVEGELGVNPSGAYATVADRLTGVNSVALDAYGQVAATQDPQTTQVGLFFNSYTLNANPDNSPGSHAVVEADIGFRSDYSVVYGGVSPLGTFSSAAWAAVQEFLDDGRKVVFNIALNGTLANINAGQFDTAIGQLGGYITAYAAANPGWKDRLIVKFLHELNVSTSYSWCVFSTTNLADAGGSVATATANAITAYRRVAAALRTASTSGGTCYALTTWEIGSTNETATAEHGLIPFDTFYPGSAYVDIVSVNVYNRFGLSSGNSIWTPFAVQATPAIEAFRRCAPGKPIMIGETSSSDAGQMTAVSVSTGGSGYTGTPTLSTTGPGTGATFTVTLSGGAISAITVLQRGRGYNDQSGFSVGSPGGGSGATFAATLLGEKYSKADWFRDTFAWVRDQTDIKYLSLFFTNAGTTGDYRWWAPNTALEKTKVFEGYGLLRGRPKSASTGVRTGTNLCPDPYANDVTKWTAAGTNAGTLTRTAGQQNNATFDKGPGDTVGAIRITHNGTAGNAQDNRVYCVIPQNLTVINENFTLSFDAYFKPTSSTVDTAWLDAGLETNDGSQFLRKLQPPIALTSQPRRYTVQTYTTTSSTGYRIAFCIGRTAMAGQLMISNVKLEYGPTASALLPARRQLTRTTVANANYSFVNGTTDEVLAFTTLTASRVVTLEDATKCLPGEMHVIKDETGNCASGVTITVGTTSSQTINGASTFVLNTPYQATRLYTDGANWFTT